MKKLLLIDGHALCYRSFYAIKELSNSKGQATNAVYGFVNTIKKLIKEYKPSYAAICFDSPVKTKRAEKFAEYKIDRPSMPDPLKSQMPIIKEVMEAFRIKMFEMGGYEADDLIATISTYLKGKDVEVIIVTEDKDMFQLADRHVKYYNQRQGKLLDEKDIEAKYGFQPAQIVDYIALAGDKVDNIPGVAGIGDVTAKKLINEYGSLEDILKQIEHIESKSVQDKLKENIDLAEVSKDLAILERDIPIDVSLEAMSLQEPVKEELFRMFKDLEFRRFAQEYATEVEMSNGSPLTEVNDQSNLDDLIARIKDQKKCGILINSQEDENQLFIAVDQDAYQISFSLWKGLRPILEAQEILKITHNLKQILKLLDGESIGLKNSFDVILAGYLINPGQNALALSDLLWQFCEITIAPEAQEKVGVGFLNKLYEKVRSELENKKLLDLFNNIEIPLSHVLFIVEKNGVKIDLSFLKKLSHQCTAAIEDLKIQLFAIAGEDFNLNSPKQLSKILFEKLKMPVIKKTKTGFSTDETVLSKLAEQHEFPTLILEYRQLAKLQSTYIDAFPKLVNEQTGLIHADFNQIGAETGRLSSRNPNLQNIPIRTELGRKIRKAFIPKDDQSQILAVDYSQIELRILAHLSEDPNLINAFQQGEDIHSHTASLMYGIEEKDVTKEMRYSAKRINFGIIYGMSAFGLAKDLKISKDEAQEFIDRYFSRYPNVKDFMDAQVKHCEDNGYVITLLNRRRYLPEIDSKNMAMRQFAQRQAINTPVQGSAADLIKLAMINIQKEIEDRQLKSEMTITVHDEIVFNMRNDESEELMAIVEDRMEHAFDLKVPIKVTIKSGPNWLEVSEVKK